MNRDFITKIDLIGALVADLDDRINKDRSFEAAIDHAEKVAVSKAECEFNATLSQSLGEPSDVLIRKYFNFPMEWIDHVPMTNAYLNRRLMVIRELCLDLIKEDYNVSCG